MEHETDEGLIIHSIDPFRLYKYIRIRKVLCAKLFELMN